MRTTRIGTINVMIMVTDRTGRNRGKRWRRRGRKRRRRRSGLRMRDRRIMGSDKSS